MEKREILFGMLISVIVPVYNTEKYLPFCIDSILNQTYEKIEIILVDDGSEDRSLAICTEYAQKDNRIIVIQNKHQGVVSTRKTGVEKSKGDYCIFVDSDDWIAENLIETALLLTDNGSVDIVNYNMKSVDGEKVTEWNYTISEGTYDKRSLDKIYKKMMFDFEKGCPGILQSLCTKLIRRTVLQSSIQSVDKRITMGEDAAVVYKSCLLAEKIAVTNKYLYFYRTTPDSMCLSKNLNIFSEIHFFQKYMNSAFSNYSEKYELDKQLQAYLLLFIKKGTTDVFSLKFKDLFHIPFSRPDIGQRVVIYGAGNVGRSYFRQLSQVKDIEIAAWIDKNQAETRIYNYKIESPDILNYISFDSLIVAVKSWQTAAEIRKELDGIVSDEKVLWEEPKVFWWEKEIDI